jgi:hypothetical protein
MQRSCTGAVGTREPSRSASIRLWLFLLGRETARSQPSLGQHCSQHHANNASIAKEAD